MLTTESLSTITSTTTTITPSQSTPSSILESLPVALNPIDTNNVIMSPTIANVRISHLQNQLSKLRDELYRTECGKIFIIFFLFFKPRKSVSSWCLTHRK
ncbi:unnamed protein product [Trichobilharzia regenti]|nr:unnamed protein product [Trichobilharzia regenti]